MTTTDTNTLRKSFASVSDFLTSSIGNIRMRSLQGTHFSNIAKLNEDFATLLATENRTASGMPAWRLKEMRTALDRTQRLVGLSETADPSVKTAYKEVEAFITKRTNLALNKRLQLKKYNHDNGVDSADFAYTPDGNVRK